MIAAQPLRIPIADSAGDARQSLRQALAKIGHDVVSEATTAPDGRRYVVNDEGELASAAGTVRARSA